MTDFLINFGSNASLVIAQMRQLEAQALRTQAVLNQVSAANARTAAAGAGAVAGGGILGPNGQPINTAAARQAATAVASVGAAAQAANPRVAGLEKQLGNLQSQMRAAATIGLAPTLAQTRREATLLQQIVAAGGQEFGRFNQNTAAAAAGNARLSGAAAASAAELRSQRAALDGTGQAFQRHVGRIQETILVYAAFAAATAAAVNSVQLATTIDTESRRLEAVLGLTQEQGRDFVGGVFQVATTTATPTEDLLSEADFVASAFSDVADAAEAEAASLELLNRVGQITTVTQRDVRTETENLIAIMRLGKVPIEDMGTVLGQVVEAGNNSSTAIGAILDALQIAIPGAELAGVSIEQLIALVGLFRQETQRSGNAIGTTFATLFQTITNEKAQNNIKEITGGLVDVRDAAGNLRPAIEILAQIRTLIDEGAIAAEKLPDIFKAFAPPLNPGAAKDVALIFDLIDELPAALREVETTGSAALDDLVEKLNSALGPQFRILIEQVKEGFFELFGADIVATGQTLIDLIRSLGEVVGSLDPDVLRAVAGLVALAVAIKGVMFVGGALLGLLGVRGITTAFAGAGAAAAAAGVSTGIFASAVGSAVVVLGRFLPLLAAWAAIDFAQQVGNQQAALRTQIGGLTEGLDEEGLLALRERLQGQITPQRQSTDTTGLGASGLGLLGARLGQMGADAITGTTVDPALQDGIKEIDRLLELLDERGEGATVTLEDLGEAFSGTADVSTEIEEAMATQADELERLIAGYTDATNASNDMTLQQQLEAEAATLLEATREAQAADLELLAERLREGTITAEEFAQGQQVVSQAAELAAQLVAVAGDRLAEYPLFAAAAAEGNDVLTEKVYEMIVASGGSISAIGGLIGQLGNLAAANAAVSSSLASNPLVIRIAVAKVSSTDLATNPELSAARRFAQNAISPSASAQSQINAILDSINSLIGGFGAGTPAFGNIPSLSGGRGGGGGGSGAKAASKPSLFDLDDFPAEKLAQAIALAQKLQASIPGAGKAAKDEVLNIIKDAQFLRTIKGLDDQLLRKAIERLTDVEEARLEEERRRNKANEILQNLNVRAGPLGALISQPTLFGVGGSIPAGLNADPNKGDFTINIPVELKGLEPSQLQALIYAAVVKAIKEGIRLSP